MSTFNICISHDSICDWRSGVMVVKRTGTREWEGQGREPLMNQCFIEWKREKKTTRGGDESWREREREREREGEREGKKLKKRGWKEKKEWENEGKGEAENRWEYHYFSPSSFLLTSPPFLTSSSLYARTDIVIQSLTFTKYFHESWISIWQQITISIVYSPFLLSDLLLTLLLLRPDSPRLQLPKPKKRAAVFLRCSNAFVYIHVAVYHIKGLWM